MVTVAIMLGIVLLTVYLLAFVAMQVLGEHVQNVDAQRRHHRRRG